MRRPARVAAISAILLGAALLAAVATQRADPPQVAWVRATDDVDDLEDPSGEEFVRFLFVGDLHEEPGGSRIRWFGGTSTAHADSVFVWREPRWLADLVDDVGLTEDREFFYRATLDRREHAGAWWYRLTLER